MTIGQAIQQVDETRDNTFSNDIKIAWLSNLDWQIKTQIYDTHVQNEPIRFNGYMSNTPLETELLVPAPHDAIYLRWLEAQVCYSLGEIEDYNAAISLYNAVFSNFRDAYSRQHASLLTAGKRFRF